METSTAKAQISLSAIVHRVNWENKPFFIPKTVWILLKRCKVPGTYLRIDLGQIAHSNEGTVSMQES